MTYTAEQRQDALDAEKAHADGKYCDVRCRETKWLCDVWNAHYPVIRELQAARLPMTPDAAREGLPAPRPA